MRLEVDMAVKNLLHVKPLLLKKISRLLAIFFTPDIV